MRRLIEEVLRSRFDYPASDSEFRDLLRANGLLLDTLHDPWGTPYRVAIQTYGTMRSITLWSAGPDKNFDTADDFAAARFSGQYFQREKAEIEQALQNTFPPPQTLEEFERTLQNAGIDVAHYRDTWGRPYRLTCTTTSHYGDGWSRGRCAFSASRQSIEPMSHR